MRVKAAHDLQAEREAELMRMQRAKEAHMESMRANDYLKVRLVPPYLLLARLFSLVSAAFPGAQAGGQAVDGGS